MQEAIEKYIDLQSKLGSALSDISDDIDKVRIIEIEKARLKVRQKRTREWRKLDKNKNW